MIDIKNGIDSLTNFKRNTSAFLDKLRQTGHPVVLTVNGKAELIVQDAASYQKMLDLVDYSETVEAIREGLKEIDAGKGMNLEQFKKKVRRKHGLSV